MIDLEPEHLQEVRRILRAFVPDCEVWAFGSRVTGKAQKFSDLDLALVAGHALDWQRIESLKDAFSASSLPIMVDVVDWRAVSESFQEKISKSHVVIQKQGAPPVA